MNAPLKDYLDYHRNNALMWEIDTHLDAAVYFADKYNLSLESRCWLAFLTSLCETTPTSLYLFKHFPSFDSATPEAFESFCSRNRGAMAFQYDVRWILYEIGKVLASYKQLIGGPSQYPRLLSFAQGRDKYQRFSEFCRRFRCYRFGNYTFMLYTELLHYLCGLDIEAVLNPEDNHSVRSGLIYACGYEGIINCVRKGTKPTRQEADLLRIELQEIIAAVRGLDILPRHKTTWAIETTLCTYNKTKHGRRYLGFYKARQAREIARLTTYTAQIGEPFDWSDLLEYHNLWGKWHNRYAS